MWNKSNEAANVLEKGLSNQITSDFCEQLWSLFHQVDHLISQFFYSRDHDNNDDHSRLFISRVILIVVPSDADPYLGPARNHVVCLLLISLSISHRSLLRRSIIGPNDLLTALLIPDQAC